METELRHKTNIAHNSGFNDVEENNINEIIDDTQDLSEEELMSDADTNYIENINRGS